MQFNLRTVSIAVTALVAASTAQLAPIQSASADPLEPIPPLAHGVLTSTADVVSARVLVYPTDDKLSSMAVGDRGNLYEVVDPPLHLQDGTFRVDLDPDAVPEGYLSPEGVAYMEILLSTESDQTYRTGVSTRLVETADGPLWVEPNANLEAFSALTAATRTQARSTDPGEVYEYEYEDDGVLAVPPVQLVASEPTPPAGCGYKKLDTRVRSATIGTTYPVGGDTAKMTVTSSSGAEYGTAVSVKDSAGNWADFKASEGKFTKSGWGFTWDGYDGSRSYRKGIEYGLYLLSCAQGCNECVKSWKPIGETGGTGSNKGISRPDWETYCAPQDPGTFWRDKSDGNSYAYGAAVKFAGVIGVDLSVNRNYTSSQKISYTFSAQRRLCGNNAYPATAGKLIERFKN